MTDEYEFTVSQDGVTVAGGCGQRYESVVADARHYAMMYAQDGPARWEVFEVARTTSGRKRKTLKLMGSMGAAALEKR